MILTEDQWNFVILYVIGVAMFTMSFAMTGVVFRLLWKVVLFAGRRLRGSPAMLDPSHRHASAELTANAIAECHGDILDVAMLTGWMEQAIIDYCIRLSRAVENAVDSGEIPATRPDTASPRALAAGLPPYTSAPTPRP